MNILHCITSLDTGGAEKTLVNLVNRSKYKHLILTIKNSHKLKKFLNDEVKVINIFPISIRRMIRLFIDIKKFDPNIIQGWMYHGDFIASFISLSDSTIFSSSQFFINEDYISLRDIFEYKLQSTCLHL